ncbi:MAG TPA: bile acid:sodium symporter family protein [Acidobacteriota bacterium]|nr:bile acid:sodium symporter family protein [Acidobacteriota bacterium]
MLVLRRISNLLAPLTLVAAIVAYMAPAVFLIFEHWFLWFFAATMFALGVVLQPEEFWEALKKPKEIGLGLITQFTVMPALGFLAAYLSPLEPGVALGFVIVGCAPGAMASNVIVYLAGGAVAYSIALTSFATLLSPVVTPGLVELLGGVFLPIPFWPMMLTILKVVLLPLILGMLVRRILGANQELAREVAPVVAVLSIVVIIGYAVAANQERIASVGWVVFGLVVLVNAFGFLAGWYLAGLYGFDRRYQLTLMIEIGMQNAGLGVALALEHFSPETALPGALFATWCVLTGAGATAYLRWKGEQGLRLEA